MLLAQTGPTSVLAVKYKYRPFRSNTAYAASLRPSVA
jgi:hypothetical protein